MARHSESRSKGRFRDRYELSSDGIFILDLEGNFIDANTAAYARLGYTKHEILSMHIGQLTAPEFATRVPEHILENQGKSVAIFESAHVRKDGTVMPVEVNSHSFDLGGERVSLLVVRDITERNESEEALRRTNEELEFRVRERTAELQESEERYRTLVETAPYGIQIANRDGLITFSNRAHHEIQGFKVGEIVGNKYIWDFIASDSVRSATKEFYAVLMNEQPEPEVVFNKDRTKDGRLIDTQINWNYMRDGNGGVIGTFAIISDITERKEVEGALHKTNQTLSALVRHSPLAIICTDTDTKVLLWNPAAESIFGWKEGEVLGKINPIVPEAKRDEYDRLREDVRSGNPYVSRELVRQRKDGTPIFLSASSSALYDADGNVTALMGIFEDITERREAEKRITESEARFRGAFENAAVGASMASLKGRFLKVNRFLCDMLGYSEEELLSRTFSDVTHPDDVHVGLDAAKKLVSGEISHTMFEKRYVRKDGKLINVVISPTVIRDGDGHPLHFFALFQDVTERKEAEKRLRESEDRFRTIFEQSSDGIMIADLEDKQQVEANHAICAMLGYTREELMSLHVEDVHPKEDLPWIMEVFERQVRGEISLAADIPMLRKDGTVIYADVNSKQIILNGKNCIVGYFRDITERKQAVEALRERERQLSESQRIAHIGSWEHNLTTNKVVWSDELFRVLGLDPRKDPADFNMYFEMIHPDDQPALKKAIEETLRTGEHFSVEYRFILKDGRTRILHAQAELSADSAGTQKILSGTAQDITERKEAETRIREALKEKEVLLKEIHHRVKNNMAIVSAMLKLQSRHASGSKVKKILEDSQNRIDSMAIVHEKLYESENLASIKVRDYVEQLSHHLLNIYTAKKVRVEHEIGDVELDIDHIVPLGLILNELLTNSLKHAFSGGAPPEIGISLSAREGVASLTYRDNGAGLPEGLDLQDAQSLGLKIIYMLSYQLKGSIRLDETDRAKYILSFPI